MTLLYDRGPGKSICPSEAARLLAPEGWRGQMEAVRATAVDLAAEGLVKVTQKGEPVDPQAARGPIRLALTEAGDG